MAVTSPQPPCVGDRVQAKDAFGLWYQGTISDIEESRRGPKVLVIFDNFPLSHARVVSDPAEIREPRSPAQTKIDNDAIVYGHAQGHVIVGGQVLYKVEKLLAQRWKGSQRDVPGCLGRYLMRKIYFDCELCT